MILSNNYLRFPLDYIGNPEDRKAHNLLNVQCRPILDEKSKLESLLRSNISELLPKNFTAADYNKDIRDAFRVSKSLYWRSDIWDLATRSSNAFMYTDIEITDIPRHSEWWIWDKCDIAIGNEFAASQQMDKYVHSMLLTPTDEGGIAGMAFILNKADGDRVSLFLMPTFIARVKTAIDKPLVASIIAARRFMALPFVTKSGLRIPNKLQRKAKSKPTIQEVETVILRRIKYERKGNAKTNSDIGWSCQWWVDGHWRNQWYPSKQTHSPKWIDAYIKGPEDKEFKYPVPVVTKVIR